MTSEWKNPLANKKWLAAITNISINTLIYIYNEIITNTNLH